MTYKEYINEKFGVNGMDDKPKKVLEAVKDFFVLYSIYEQSFNMRTTVGMGTIKTVIENLGMDLEEIDELYEHFHNRYTKYPEKRRGLFENAPRNQTNQNAKIFFNDCLAKGIESVSNIEKQIFLGILANRYRNNTLHGTKGYVNWYEYENEFEILNKYLHMYLEKKGF